MSIQVAGLGDLLSKIKTLPKDISAAVAAEIQDGAQLIAADAKAAAPGDQGFLRNQIAAIKVSDTIWTVTSGADYSAFVEFGTGEKVQIPAGLEEYAAQFKGDFSSGTYSDGDSNLSAKDAIFQWCERKGIDKQLWYAIYVSIMIHGTEAQPFFFPSVLKNTPIIINRVKQAINDAL